MDPTAQPSLGPSVHHSKIVSPDLLPPKGLPETQQIGETLQAAGAAENLSTYAFPQQRLKQVQNDSSREPLVLVACGLFPLHVLFHALICRFNFFNMSQDPFLQSHFYIYGYLRWLMITSSFILTTRSSEVSVISPLLALLSS